MRWSKLKHKLKKLLDYQPLKPLLNGIEEPDFSKNK